MIRFLQTPGKTKKIVLGGLLMVICGAMVITLVPGGILGDAFGLGNPQGNIIAKVGDQEVTVNEVQDAARQMGKQQFPRGFPQQFMPFLMQRAAQQLIVQKAMVAEAHRMGFKVTDAELQSELQRGCSVTTMSSPKTRQENWASNWPHSTPFMLRVITLRYTRRSPTNRRTCLTPPRLPR